MQHKNPLPRNNFAGCISVIIATSNPWLLGWTCTCKLSLPCTSPTLLRAGEKKEDILLQCSKSCDV